MRGTIQKGLAEPIQAVMDPGETLIAATWADHRDGGGETVAALIGGGAAVGLLRKGGPQMPTYTGYPGLTGHVPLGYVAVAVTDRRLLFLWAPSPKATPVPTYAFAPHDIVDVNSHTGAFNATLDVLFADNTMVVLDLLRTHKAASVAKAAKDLVQHGRAWG